MAVGKCEGKAFAGIVNLRRVSRGLLLGFRRLCARARARCVEQQQQWLPQTAARTIAPLAGRGGHGEVVASPPYRRRLNGLCNSRVCRPRLRP